MFNSSRRQIRNQQLEMLRDISGDVEESDFVPYACFYDQHTIITKNGELCQTIKITGINRDNINSGASDKDLRSLIRDSLKNNVPNDSFAIWLHTLRRKTDLSSTAHFEAEGFAKDLHTAWIGQNQFADQYVNEVFITIVHEGQDARLRHFKNFLRGLVPAREIKYRQDYIDSASKVLNTVTENILNDLNHYGAYRLGMYKEDGIYYSEQLRFLEKIINFVDRPMPMVEIDLSTYLTTGEITFAFNAMEVRTSKHQRRFGSLLTLKEYKEASLPAIDSFLQLPTEFIITQTVNFVNPQKVLSDYEEVANYQRMSGDPDIFRMSELKTVMESNRNRPNDFGEQQLTIFILSDSVNQLEHNIKRSIKFFAKYGMVAIREDLKIEETYWSQLPGNFVFVTRMKQTNTSHVAGFTNLNNMPVGTASKNHWGDAITIFHTASGAPYYFNFHVGYQGHTIVAGPARTGKGFIVNFLLSESMKHKPKIYYFDGRGTNALLMSQLGAESCAIAPAYSEGQQGLFNPFGLSRTEENMQFLARWMGVLAKAEGYSLTDMDKQSLNNAISYVYNLPEQQRNLQQAVNMMSLTAPEYVEAIKQWLPQGTFGHLFTADYSMIGAGRSSLHIDVEGILNNPALCAASISFILQHIIDSLDGTPTIIAMQESWILLAQTHFGGNISAFLNTLTQRNAILLSVIEEIVPSSTSPITKQIVDGSVTHIFMPDKHPDSVYQTIYGLDNNEFSYLDVMETKDHHFLLKHNKDTIICEMNLTGLENFFPILSGEAKE
jgi:type IV secretion system protein VirB4